MIMYSESMMLSELTVELSANRIVNPWEREFIKLRQDSHKSASIVQYNKLLDLYNKYIVVPASPSQTLRATNYE